MKKLDNNGWGLQVMILLVALLVIFLFIVVVVVYKVYWEDNINLVDKEYIVQKM